MKLHSNYALGIALLTAVPAFGQAIIGMSSNSSNQNGVWSGSATFNVRPFSPPVVAGAPYSGEEVHESVQTLADGTHITHQMPMGQKTWRDSQGRIRTERGLMGGNPNRAGAPTFAQISDPVAGYVYVLDDVNHVAHRVKLTPNGERPAPRARPAGAAAPAMAGVSGTTVVGGIIGSVPVGGGVTGRARPQTTTEDLGTKMIDGVLVFGTRRTMVIPEGMQGNDRPMTTTSETWTSKDLHLTVLSTNYNPANGTSTTKIANLSTIEPDPALFMVPGDYSVVDEIEKFTINWVEK